jgi:hypothetical protein
VVSPWNEEAKPMRIPGRTPAVVSAGTALAAFGVYAATAARTITWWEGASYPLAASTLGIEAPPGSLLLTVLGWLWLRLPLPGAAAFRLNLLAGGLAALTVGLVAFIAIRLATPEDREPGLTELVAGAFTGLTFASAPSVWSHAVRFTPYILTALFAALILLTALAWAREGRTVQLFVLFLLLGLDFSVHRTNLLLFPGLLFWLVQRPRRVRLDVIVGGFALGLAFQLLLIPMSRRDPWFDLGYTKDLGSLWSYVRLDMTGGNFLINAWPRRADLVHVQLADYGMFLWSNVGPVALGLALAGFIAAFRAAPQRTLGLTILFLCASFGAVAYFNVPPRYFRPLDRHYLASLVLLAPMLGVGAAALARAAQRWPAASGRAAALALMALVIALPARSLIRHRPTCDLARARFADAYARNVLATLPRDAILFTNGDNDSFPLWHAQGVLGLRRDVSVINLPMTNVPDYVAKLGRNDPRLAGLPAPGKDWVRLEDPKAAVGADSVTFEAKGNLYPVEGVVFEIVRRFAKDRPVYVATTVTPVLLTWMRDHLALDGMSYRLVAGTDIHPDLPALRHAMLDVVDYAGLADTTITLDPATKAMASNYIGCLNQLAWAELNRGNRAAALETIAFAEVHVPPSRLGLSDDPFAMLRAQVRAAGH